MEEVWRDIEGYEGKYAVSNLGRVKSLERIDSLGRLVKEKILSPGNNGHGYLFVNLCRNGERKRYKVHRLVLSTFNPIENMENLDCNHLDENKENNNLNNLEWVTHKENINHGTRNDRVGEKLRGKFNTKKSLPIAQLTLEGKLVKAYKSSYDAQRIGGFDPGNINKCCKGKLKTYKGYRFMYLSEFLDKHNGIID